MIRTFSETCYSLCLSELLGSEQGQFRPHHHSPEVLCELGSSLKPFIQKTEQFIYDLFRSSRVLGWYNLAAAFVCYSNERCDFVEKTPEPISCFEHEATLAERGVADQ